MFKFFLRILKIHKFFIIKIFILILNNFYIILFHLRLLNSFLLYHIFIRLIIAHMMMSAYEKIIQIFFLIFFSLFMWVHKLGLLFIRWHIMGMKNNTVQRKIILYQIIININFFSRSKYEAFMFTSINFIFFNYPFACWLIDITFYILIIRIILD